MSLLSNILVRPKSISTINDNTWDPSKYRKFFSIAVIDDQAFPYLDLLRGHGYDIYEIGDPKSLQSIQGYEIIVCDIKGVGRHFGGRDEGGHLIREIRRYYPYKYIIAYSEHRFSPDAKRFLDAADTSMRKASDIEDWVESLDIAIRKTGHPLERWKRSRDILISQEMELYDLYILEQKYIISITNANPKIISKYIRKNRERYSLESLRVLDSMTDYLDRILSISVNSAAALTSLAPGG